VWSETGEHRRPTSYHSVSLEPPVCLRIRQGLIRIWKKDISNWESPPFRLRSMRPLSKVFFMPFRFVSLKMVSRCTHGGPNNREQLTGNCVL
jgi:hypothetical protein